MTTIDVAYQKLVKRILKDGFTYTDETRDVERIQIPNATIEWRRDLEPILAERDNGRLNKPMPVLTLKEMYWNGIATELLWFLRGDNSLEYLHKHGVHIWDKDAESYWSRLDDENEDKVRKLLGSIYGLQWRDFKGDYSRQGDQIFALVQNLLLYPLGTRHLVTAWNPTRIGHWALPPCHWAFEVLVEPRDSSYGFTIKWHQRSVDTFLGLPFNIASYALLGYILEGITGYRFLGLIGDLSNVHIYSSHLEQAKTIAKRKSEYYAPELDIHESTGKLLQNIREAVSQHGYKFDREIERLTPEDFRLRFYYSCGKIPAEMIAPKKV
nr:MAG TPA: Thymidylate synthase [Caudoviricetes sp.]